MSSIRIKHSACSEFHFEEVQRRKSRAGKSTKNLTIKTKLTISRRSLTINLNSINVGRYSICMHSIMKNPFKYLIPAYYTALNGQITINGTVLPVYDGLAAPNADSSYIMIGERTSSQLNAKCSFTSECFVLIDIVLKGYGYGFKDTEEAADQILDIINIKKLINTFKFL